MSKAKEELAALVETFGEDHDKFEKGNHSAGVRARKTLQAIKVKCSDIKKDMLGSEAE